MSFRVKAKEALKCVMARENNINIFEKNIYDVTEKKLKDNEDLETVYFKNVFQIVMDIKENKDKLGDILKNIKEGKLHFNHTHLETLIYEEREQDNFIITPFEIEEGVLQCKCGSKRVFSYQKQSRGGDESSSTYAECTSCKAKWVYSG